jgi:hypothetical protein
MAFTHSPHEAQHIVGYTPPRIEVRMQDRITEKKFKKFSHLRMRQII